MRRRFKMSIATVSSKRRDCGSLDYDGGGGGRIEGKDIYKDCLHALVTSSESCLFGYQGLAQHVVADSN